jgi:glutamate formiminotransferase/formiminotetrahydrofolate cyclodeaminase
VSKLVECVPNFSDGQRPEVLEAIEAAIAAVPGVTILDRHRDADHNRSVVTFVGDVEDAREAAFRAIARAAELIDITKHKGEHPRIGATDVVPFIPLGATSMRECVRAAEALGEAVASRLGIPVYLYEQAARRPERRNLANVRRGEFEALRAEIASNPERAPDLGAARLHPTAGAVAIGARFFLIAFNVNLATSDVNVAKAIAARIREAGGGFEAVRALGFRLREQGVVQVSMNLVDFRKTSMADAFGRVQELAREHGVEVVESELVGLAPEAALIGAARDALKLRKLDRRQIVEERLKELIAGPFELHAFLDAVASTRPSPGGGSTAGLAGALASAAAAKVVNLTRSKARFAPVKEEFDALARSLSSARWELLKLVERDANAFEAILEARRLPREGPEDEARRLAAIDAATLEASRTPLAIAERIATVLRCAWAAGERGNRGVLADVVAAASLGRGALEAAHAMLRVNLAGMRDRAAAAELRERFDALRTECDDLARSIDVLFEKELAAQASIDRRAT